MANIKVSGLPETSTVNDNDLLLVTTQNLDGTTYTSKKVKSSVFKTSTGSCPNTDSINTIKSSVSTINTNTESIKTTVSTMDVSIVEKLSTDVNFTKSIQLNSNSTMFLDYSNMLTLQSNQGMVWDPVPFDCCFIGTLSARTALNGTGLFIDGQAISKEFSFASNTTESRVYISAGSSLEYVKNTTSTATTWILVPLASSNLYTEYSTYSLYDFIAPDETIHPDSRYYRLKEYFNAIRVYASDIVPTSTNPWIQLKTQEELKNANYKKYLLYCTLSEDFIQSKKLLSYGSGGYPRENSYIEQPYQVIRSKSVTPSTVAADKLYINHNTAIGANKCTLPLIQNTTSTNTCLTMYFNSYKAKAPNSSISYMIPCPASTYDNKIMLGELSGLTLN